MLIVFIALCEAAGVVGSIFTATAIKTWYVTLAKPSFNPPSWLFGPVWLILYLLMGVAMYLVYKKGWPVSQKALIFFGIHLLVNAAWSIIFFGQRQIGWALADIVVMWLMIVISMYLFWQLDRRAALLLLPYLAWVSFATVLNYSIWRLNV